MFSALFVHKYVGMTSSDVVQHVKKIFFLKNRGYKIGHTGILDKQASGLLIVLLGRATRLSKFFLTLDKKYRSVFFLGEETTTLDSVGRCIKRAALPTEEAYINSFEKFRGEIKQQVPEFSSVHIEGRRAYQRVINNETVVMPTRTVKVYESKILKLCFPQVECYFHTSSGTYIRSLARDIAKDCGSVAYMSSLVRTHIADFSLKNAYSLEDLEKLQKESKTEEDKFQMLNNVSISADLLLKKILPLDTISVKDTNIRTLVHRGVVPEILKKTKSEYISVYDEKGFLALYTQNEKKWKCVVHTA